MKELFEEVRAEQERQLSDDRVRRDVASRLRDAPLPAPARPARARWLELAAAAAVAGLTVGAAAWWRAASDPPAPPEHAAERTVERTVERAAPEPALTYTAAPEVHEAAGGFLAAADAPGEVRFSDGSALTLAPEAQARVVSLDGAGAAVAIERGRVHADVRHREDTRWRVLAGPFVVHVVGTRLAVAWSGVDASLVVEVTEGAVRVDGGCLEAPHPVAAGDSLRVTCPELALAPAASTEPRAALRPRGEGARVDNVRSEAAPDDAAPDYAVGVDTGSALAEARRSAAAGELERAARLLAAVRSEAPGTDDAALAAFLLGRLAFDEQDDHEAAARWFRTYRRERPGGALAREAHGRLMEALQRAGHTDEARALAVDYLARHPQGPHASVARRLTEARAP